MLYFAETKLIFHLKIKNGVTKSSVFIMFGKNKINVISYSFGSEKSNDAN